MTIYIVHSWKDSSGQDEILKQLLLITKNQKLIMTKLEELQQTVTDLQTSVDTKQQAIADAIAALEAQVANLPVAAATEADLQGIIDSLKATQSDVDSTPTA